MIYRLIIWFHMKVGWHYWETVHPGYPIGVTGYSPMDFLYTQESRKCAICGIRSFYVHNTFEVPSRPVLSCKEELIIAVLES